MNRTTRLLAVTVVLAVTVAGCAPGESTPVVAAVSPSSVNDSRETILAENVAAARQDILDQFPDAAIPVVDRVRIITLSEYATVTAACLVELGLEAVVDGDSVRTLVLPAHELEQRLGFYVCQLKYPIDAKYTMELTSAQLRLLYAYLTESLIPCFEALGYSISEPPVEEAFVDTYYDELSWSPATEAHNQSVDSEDGNVEQLDALCPQVPDSVYG